MKIILPGGSGQLGLVLARHFLRANHQVVILSRQTAPRKVLNMGEEVSPFSDSRVRMVAWDGKRVEAQWRDEIEGSDVVINLAGRSVNCRYHQKNRRLIMESRVDSARAVGQAITQCQSPPSVWLQSSTATIYSHRYDAANDEASGVIGGEEPDLEDTWKFSIDVAKAWEAAATEFNLPTTRQVLMRTAMVMSPDANGVFDVLTGLVKKFLGGRNGDGRQFVSWIHENDFVAAIDRLITDKTLEGPVNVASPNPLPNSDFMKGLRDANGVSFGLPASRWMLEIGARLMKTETELLLKSRRVVPGKLSAAGFEFQFPRWAEACKDLARKLATAKG